MPQQQAGRNAPYLNIFPGPLFLNSAPTAATQAEVGQAAIVSSANAIYWCVNRVGSVYTWAAQSSGSASLASLVVNPGDIDITAGDLNVTAGNITATAGTTALGILTAGNSTINGTFDVTGLSTFTGDVVFNGDVDISSTDALSFTTTSNTAPAISFVSNGGVLETIVVTNTQGTAANAIDLNAVAGGITADAAGAISLDAAAASNMSVSGAGIDLTLASAAGRVIVNGEEAAANAITLLSAAGGLDANVALQMNLDSSQAAADAVRIIASGVAGGIDIDCGTGGAALDSTGAISIDAAAASNMSVSGAGIDLTLASAAGRVIVNGEEAAADAVTLLSAAGGIDADAALEINIASSQAAATAISMDASNAAGGVTIAAGTGGLNFGNQADCTTIGLGDFAPTASRTISIGGGTVVTAAVTDTVDIAPDGATTNANSIKTVNVNSGGVTLGQVLTNIATGAITSGTHTVSIQSGNAAAGTVACNISTGTGTKTVNVGNADGLTTTAILGPINLNLNQNSAVTINTGTSTGAVTIGSANAGAIGILSSTTIDVDGVGAVSLNSSGAALNVGNDANNFAINVGTAGTRTITVGSATATNVVVGTSSINASANFNSAINSGTSTGTVTIGNGAAGAVTIDSGAGISIDAATASNFSAAAGDLTLAAATNSVVISAAEAAVDSIALTNATAGAGVQITTGALATNTGVHLVQGAATVGIYVGAGAPAFSAPKGSLYLRTDGTGVNDRAYIATDAVGTFTAIVTVA